MIWPLRSRRVSSWILAKSGLGYRGLMACESGLHSHAQSLRLLRETKQGRKAKNHSSGQLNRRSKSRPSAHVSLKATVPESLGDAKRLGASPLAWAAVQIPSSSL